MHFEAANKTKAKDLMITQFEHTCEHKNANSNASRDEIHDKKNSENLLMDEQNLS